MGILDPVEKFCRYFQLSWEHETNRNRITARIKNKKYGRLLRLHIDPQKDSEQEQQEKVAKRLEHIKDKIQKKIRDKQIKKPISTNSLYVEQYNRWYDQCDKVASKFIRMRDAIRTTGSPDLGRCITCNKLCKANTSSRQRGHFMQKGSCPRLRRDPTNAHGQCGDCNKRKSGAQAQHARAIDDLYGRGTAKKLQEKAKDSAPFTLEEIKEITNNYADGYNDMVLPWPSIELIIIKEPKKFKDL